MGPSKFASDTALLAVLMAGLAACGGQAAGTPAKKGGGPAVPIRTTAVHQMAVQRQGDLAGTRMSRNQAKVSSEAPGIVIKVLVEIGSDGGVGDPLVRLDSQELSL